MPPYVSLVNPTRLDYYIISKAICQYIFCKVGQDFQIFLEIYFPAHRKWRQTGNLSFKKLVRARSDFVLFSADNGRSAAALGDGENIFYPAVLASPLARNGAAARVNRSLDEVEPPVCHGAEDNMLETRGGRGRSLFPPPRRTSSPRPRRRHSD